jgi:hypothetical protein
MAKKVVKKLVKKNYGGSDSTPANTIKAKQIYMDVTKNPNYRKTSITDPTGEAIHVRKTGYEGPSKAVKGVVGPSGTYALDAVSKKAVIPTVTTKPIVAKKGGAISKFAKLAPPYNKVTFADKIAGAKKKMGGSTKKK